MRYVKPYCLINRLLPFFAISDYSTLKYIPYLCTLNKSVCTPDKNLSFLVLVFDKDESNKRYLYIIYKNTSSLVEKDTYIEVIFII